MFLGNFLSNMCTGMKVLSDFGPTFWPSGRAFDVKTVSFMFR